MKGASQRDFDLLQSMSIAILSRLFSSSSKLAADAT